MKCKIADCLSILVSFKKKQRIRKFIFKASDLSLNQYVLKGLATVFSLGSLGRVISGRVLYHVIYPDLLRSYRFIGNHELLQFILISIQPILRPLTHYH